MASSHARALLPRKLSKKRKARKYASCTISSASLALPLNQRARLYAASRCGSATSEKRRASSVASTVLSCALPMYDRLGLQFIPGPGLAHGANPGSKKERTAAYRHDTREACTKCGAAIGRAANRPAGKCGQEAGLGAHRQRDSRPPARCGETP